MRMWTAIAKPTIARIGRHDNDVLTCKRRVGDALLEGSDISAMAQRPPGRKRTRRHRPCRTRAMLENRGTGRRAGFGRQADIHGGRAQIARSETRIPSAKSRCGSRRETFARPPGRRAGRRSVWKATARRVMDCSRLDLAVQHESPSLQVSRSQHPIAIWTARRLAVKLAGHGRPHETVQAIAIE